MINRTIHVFQPAIRLSLSRGERLEHTVTFRGQTAVFSIVDDNSQSTVLSNQDPGPPYQASWQGPPNTETAHGFGCSFVAAVQYTWKATIVGNNNIRTLVVHIDYNSSTGTDIAADALAIQVRA